jgi:hypothetical protein
LKTLVLITNTAAPSIMNPSILFAVAAVAVGAIVLAVRRVGRVPGSRAVDAGAVSTRWLSELRRDEPWTRS